MAKLRVRTSQESVPRASEVDDLTELVASVALGDERALDRLWKRTGGWIYRSVLRLVGDAEQAEEITLEVYVQVWRTAASYSETLSSVTAWLAMIARSRSIDALRARARREDHQRTFEAALASPFSHENDPADRSALEENRKRVSEAVSKLPDAQRRAIELAFFEGLTHREIARELKIPLGTVKTRIRRGMEEIRDRLGREEVGQ